MSEKKSRSKGGDSKDGGKCVAIVVPRISKTFDAAIDSLVLSRWPRAGALKPHEVRVQIHASALNFFDLLGMVGRYQVRYVPPYVCGSEASGVVTEVGSGVAASGGKAAPLRVGDAVIIPMAGALFADSVVVPAAVCLRKPAKWSHASAAAVSVGFLTAYHGLVHRAKIRPGQILLVTGAAGGMG
jgi:NADPH:quinone reductase